MMTIQIFDKNARYGVVHMAMGWGMFSIKGSSRFVEIVLFMMKVHLKESIKRLQI